MRFLAATPEAVPDASSNANAETENAETTAANETIRATTLKSREFSI